MRPTSERIGKTKLSIGIGVLFFVASAYLHQPPLDCPTALSRLDLLHAVATGSVAIDAYHENTPDKAFFRGHYYSDKAPGTVVLAFPGFAAGVAALRLLEIKLDSNTGWLVSSWAACAGSIGILSAIGASALFLWLSRHAKPESAVVTVLALFFGAAPFPYATMMFSHAFVVGCIAIAIWAIARQEDMFVLEGQEATVRVRKGRAREVRAHTIFTSATFSERFWDHFKRNRWHLAAGFACGWALASEYTSGIVIASIFCWILSKSAKRVIPFCLATVPPLLMIPVYNWMCFHNPFILPYSLNASFPEMQEGLYAIKLPNPATAIDLLFSPARGLLFWTPFLFVAVPGYWKLFQVDKRLFWFTYAAPVLQVVVISGRTWDWTAGPTLGPRYLAPILPMLALPCAIGVQRFPLIGKILALYSILLTTFATLVNASPGVEIQNPLLELHLPFFLQGKLAPNIGTSAGLPPYASVVAFYFALIAGVIWIWRVATRIHRKDSNEPTAWVP